MSERGGRVVVDKLLQCFVGVCHKAFGRRRGSDAERFFSGDAVNETLNKSLLLTLACAVLIDYTTIIASILWSIVIRLLDSSCTMRDGERWFSICLLCAEPSAFKVSR